MEGKWGGIGPTSGQHGLRLLRISGQCIPELSLGLDGNLKRCLVLSLDSIVNLEMPETTREHLSLSLLKEQQIQHVVIKLADAYFNDLFNDLILSIYNKISKIELQSDQARELIRSFYKWSEFFIRSSSSRLSREQIQGLSGELKFLRECVGNEAEMHIDDQLRAWRGPYDNSSDFIFENKSIEVKTILSGKNSVRISSEFQLATEPEKDLELLIFEVDLNPQDGTSLSDQLKLLKEAIYERLGDYTIILETLRQKGLNMSNVSDYDNFRFVFLSKRVFNAADDGFPKLTANNTPQAVDSISYAIKLPLLTEYLVQTVNYDTL
ncbi:conserved hypothetical protein [Coraliomargarita akajimensis DSM 45221]|uniref:PD-(D/E)XK motif protein n=2 Tax=Coraliomargarita TaxID=442430 RepID=D5EQ11_CORAD|nr:conserved hypothetical protein [Coraliomargarita akajimensis DSM 45221]